MRFSLPLYYVETQPKTASQIRSIKTNLPNFKGKSHFELWQAYCCIYKSTGGFMNKQQILTITLAVLAISLLTSCAVSESKQIATNSSVITTNPQQALASCNQSTSDNFVFNIANVIDSGSQQVNPEWIKVKFSFLSENITKPGYSFKFYKWRVLGGSVQLDTIPLSLSTYTITNGQTTTEPSTGVFTSQIGKQTGLYIQLKDDMSNPYQVLKVVVYKSDGTVAAQTDALIPQFLASPIEYKTNSDGSVRSGTLQKLHPLNATDTKSWSQDQYMKNFEQYCF